LGGGGGGAYLFQMNYRGLLSYNGFFVKNKKSKRSILIMNIGKWVTKKFFVFR